MVTMIWYGKTWSHVLARTHSFRAGASPVSFTYFLPHNTNPPMFVLRATDLCGFALILRHLLTLAHSTIVLHVLGGFLQLLYVCNWCHRIIMAKRQLWTIAYNWVHFRYTQILTLPCNIVARAEVSMHFWATLEKLLNNRAASLKNLTVEIHHNVQYWWLQQ